jgi:hypothetical protein
MLSLNETAGYICGGLLYIFRGLTPALCPKHILNHFDRGEGDLKSFYLSVWSEALSLKLGGEDSLGYERSRGNRTSLASRSLSPRIFWSDKYVQNFLKRQ